MVLVLLVCDPVTSAATPLGRWLYGLLYGGLVLIFALGWSGAAPVQIAVSAALLASLAAPLLDEIAHPPVARTEATPWLTSTRSLSGGDFLSTPNESRSKTLCRRLPRLAVCALMVTGATVVLRPIQAAEPSRRAAGAAGGARRGRSGHGGT